MLRYINRTLDPNQRGATPSTSSTTPSSSRSSTPSTTSTKKKRKTLAEPAIKKQQASTVIKKQQRRRPTTGIADSILKASPRPIVRDHLTRHSDTEIRIITIDEYGRQLPPPSVLGSELLSSLIGSYTEVLPRIRHIYAAECAAFTELSDAFGLGQSIIDEFAIITYVTSTSVVSSGSRRAKADGSGSDITTPPTLTITTSSSSSSNNNNSTSSGNLRPNTVDRSIDIAANIVSIQENLKMATSTPNYYLYNVYVNIRSCVDSAVAATLSSAAIVEPSFIDYDQTEDVIPHQQQYQTPEYALDIPIDAFLEDIERSKTTATRENGVIVILFWLRVVAQVLRQYEQRHIYSGASDVGSGVGNDDWRWNLDPRVGSTIITANIAKRTSYRLSLLTKERAANKTDIMREYCRLLFERFKIIFNIPSFANYIQYM